MANVVVVGAQWGDEGKGKIVDWLSEQADIVVRFQGDDPLSKIPEGFRQAQVAEERIRLAVSGATARE